MPPGVSGCRRPCHFFVENTGSGGKERYANKVRPKQPPRHERGYQSCNEAAIQEMLHPENNQGNRNENSSNRLALVHDGKTWCPFHSAARTLSSLHELACCGAPHRAQHPRALREGKIVVSPPLIPVETPPPFSGTPAIFGRVPYRVPPSGFWGEGL